MNAALIDTHALLWLIDNNPKLSKPALARISEPGIELFFSHAGAWDMVDVWVGRFPSSEAVDAYFKETFGEGDQDSPISRFAADVGTWFYDHDFVEYEFHEAPVVDFPAALSKHSFASSYALPAARAFDAAPLIPFNLVLVMSSDQIDNPASAAGPDRILRYLGRFKCDTAAG